MTYLIIGRRELGKTTLAYYLARKMTRRVVFDPRGLVRPIDRNVGTRVVRDLEGIQLAIAELSDPASSVREVIITPTGDVQTAFDQLCEELRYWILNIPEQPIAVLIDEVTFVDLRAERFQWLLRCSPRESFHIFLTGHRPADVPTTTRAIADYWMIFKFTQEHDLKVINERCGSQVVTAVERLEPRQFVKWDDAHGKGTLYADPRQWFVEIRKPRSADVVAPPTVDGGTPSDDRLTGTLFQE